MAVKKRVPSNLTTMDAGRFFRVETMNLDVTLNRMLLDVYVSPRLVEQELLTLPVHLSSPPVFSGVRVTRSLVLYVCFIDRCWSFCTFSFVHCIVFSSSIYGFCLPVWYLQTLLKQRKR